MSRFSCRLMVLVVSILVSGAWAQDPQAPRPVPKLALQPVTSDEGYGLLPPGTDPQNRLGVIFFQHLAEDQKQFWTSPLRIDRKSLPTLVPFVGFTGVLFASDSWLSKQVPDKPNQLMRSKNISDYAVYSLIGAGGGAFLWGHLTHNDRLQETGLLSGEAAINSTSVTYLLKQITQRPRPMADHGDGTFFQGGQSFPSEHSAIA